MNPGKLNTRVIIKQFNNTSDGYGGVTNTLSTYSTIWANVKQIDGEKSSKYGQRETKTNVELLCRAETIDQLPGEYVFQIDGSSDNYRINNVFESEFKYITKIIGTKIE
tara:strand:- start:159 stop:485 length:327 start_codon:yes stop_codon:yes gene_type:complete